MQQSLRSSKYVDAENCSVVQIREGTCCVLGRPLYTTVNSEVDYSNDWMEFYEVEDIHSLNQSVDNPKPKTIRLPLNIAFDILECFKELEKENVERVKRLTS